LPGGLSRILLFVAFERFGLRSGVAAAAKSNALTNY
jgi:hypothetical protein